jgi:hypothetical protein
MSEKMQNDPMDLMWETHMQTLTKRMRNMEVKQIIDDALFEYYSNKGLDVPNWKMQKDPQWWIDYLKELENDNNRDSK